MKFNLILIGNSQGIRLPKAVIKQCGFKRTIKAEINGNKLILSSDHKPRQGWKEAFKAMAKAGDDALIDPEIFALDFDDKAWQW